MDQEEKNETAEVKEETETPVETKTPETPKKPVKKKNALTPFILAAIVIVVGIMTLSQTLKGQTNQGCTVVPQAAFGQSQQLQWIDSEDQLTADYLAKFKLTVPDNPVPDYPTVHYYVYTEQIYEIRYFNSNSEEGLRIAKGKMCGEPVYDVTQKFTSTNIVQIGDKEVTEYGDATTISIATWTSGEFSYCIGAWNKPLAKDTMEKLISEVE